jgi:DNA-binding NtrC family response regulator
MTPHTIRVLLVEDDQDDYVLFADTLREVTRRQHVVDWAPTYDAALQAIARGCYDVCLVDYRLGAGNGTRFRVYLPALTASVTAPAAPRPSEIPRGAGECVLVVDDEHAIRDLVRRTLESFNYRVLTAGDGTEGLSQFIQHQGAVRLVMTDMMMPKLAGAALMRAIANLNPEAPFIAIRGLEHNDKAAHAATDGYTDFLVKPFTAEALLRAVAKALHQPKPVPAAK